MKRWSTLFVSLTFVLVALSGCASKSDNGGATHEPSASDFAANRYDRAIGNVGYRISGTPGGAAQALSSESAVQLDILDEVDNDAQGAKDKATFILDARQTGFEVQASLRQMVTGADTGLTGDHQGGTARNLAIFGTSGIGPSDLPQVTAYLFAVGFAQVRIGESVQPNQLVYVAVMPGLRDEATQAPLSTPNDGNVQLHVLFPGSLIAGNDPIAGVPDGFLYYYFETVAVQTLSESDRAGIGANLIEPEAPNVPPVAVGQVIVNGNPATVAVRSGNTNVTVTFDGSQSSDEDGNIIRWVWRVAELAVNDTWERPTDGAPAVVQGERVEYNFNSSGWKLIELTVVDERGGSGTYPVTFYINQHRIYPGHSNTHSDTVSGGLQCEANINCFNHEITVGLQAQSMRIEFKLASGSGPTQNRHIDLYAPGADPSNASPIASSAVNQPLTVNRDKISEPGRYRAFVWWETGAAVAYSLDVLITYAPSAPA
jgi:hypothetical protein